MSRRATQKHAARVVRDQLARERRRRRTMWTSIIATLAVLVAGIVGYLAYAGQKPDAGFRVPASATADQSGVRVGDGPVTVEVYLDYLCPACQAFEADAGQTINRLVDDGSITLIYHPVAILDRFSTNDYSSRSAAGAGCAADAGMVSAYTTALYADQPAEGGAGHTDEQLVEIAAGAGLPREAFGTCLREGVYNDWIKHTTAEMDRRGVRGTPTVFVDGAELASPSAQRLASAVEAAR